MEKSVKRRQLAREFASKGYREAFAEAHLGDTLPLQIRILRMRRGLTQGDLGKRAGMKQSQISRMERPGSSRWSITSLQRLARALDVALAVRFESFGSVFEESWDSTADDLAVPSFADDPVFQKASFLEGHIEGFLAGVGSNEALVEGEVSASTVQSIPGSAASSGLSNVLAVEGGS
jgi:transcriptional regulator with XRE-family HTH domain